MAINKQLPYRFGASFHQLVCDTAQAAQMDPNAVIQAAVVAFSKKHERAILKIVQARAAVAEAEARAERRRLADIKEREDHAESRRLLNEIHRNARLVE
jgi:hypothetical protein